jgi:predicted lipoprotein with Yx(FWY)xxD motif
VKRILIPIVALAALALAAGALAASHGATIKLAGTSAGKLLTNGSGRTLYMFSKDGHNKNRCGAISGCESTWPPVTTKAKPVAGPGVKGSLLGTITISRGRHQVTYAGHPLYTYSGDFGPRQTDYIGQSQFGGTWYGVSATGGKVK